MRRKGRAPATSYRALWPQTPNSGRARGSYSKPAIECGPSMAPVLRLKKSTRTGAKCFAISHRTFDDRRRCRHTRRTMVVLAPVSLAEVVYLVEKGRLPATAFEDLRAALQNPNHVLDEAPFTSDVVSAMRQVPRDAVPDMPDRIVAPERLFTSAFQSSAGTAASVPRKYRRSGEVWQQERMAPARCTASESRGYAARRFEIGDCRGVFGNSAGNEAI